MRLRARLLLLIGAALLPAVAVQIHYERQARSLREANDQADILRLVHLVGADIESVVEGAQQFLAAAANLDAVTSGDRAACSRTLTELGRDTPRYAAFAVVDASGGIVCGSQPAAIGRNVADLQWSEVLKQGESFAIGRTGGRPTLHIARALKAGQHGQDGAVVAALDLGWLARRLAAIPLPPGGEVMVADHAGTVIARWPDHERHVGSPAPPDLQQALQRRDYGVHQTHGVDGVFRSTVVMPVGDRQPGLYVGIVLDGAAAEATLDRANRRALLLMGAGALATLMLGLFVARRFMERPVDALLATMERWRAGDAGARASGDPRLGGPDGQGEFRRIAAAFDAAAEAVEAREVALRESDARFHQITAAVDDVLLLVEPDRQRVIYASASFERLHGRSTLTYERIPEIVHPEDWPRLAAQLRLPADQPLDTEYRIRRPDGTERRVRHRRFPVAGSRTGRAVVVVSDVTEERAAADRQIMLAREVDHRAKNILAVVQSIVRLSRADSPRAFAAAVEGRVAALARAHQLLAQSRWVGVDLVTLLREECAPYTTGGRTRSTAERCLLEGPPLQLGPEAVQSIAMVVHELATNSAKHGALSVPAGIVRIGWALAPRQPDGPAWFELHWVESGGPPIRQAPERLGFGSRVVAATVERQLGGEVRYDWAATGLCCHLAMPAARLLQPQAAEPAPLPMPAPVAMAGRHLEAGDPPATDLANTR